MARTRQGISWTIKYIWTVFKCWPAVIHPDPVDKYFLAKQHCVIGGRGISRPHAQARQAQKLGNGSAAHTLLYLIVDREVYSYPNAILSF